MESPLKECEGDQLKLSVNNESKNGQCELSWAFVLQGVMHNVCKYLKICDLSSVAQVCKWWNNEVSRELNKRPLEWRVFPSLVSENVQNPIPLSRILNNIPCVSVLFPTNKLPLTEDVFLENIFLQYYFYSTYEQQLPNKFVIIGTHEAMFNGSFINSCVVEDEPVEAHPTRYRPNSILGLFLPTNRKLNTKISYIRKLDCRGLDLRSAREDDDLAKLNSMMNDLTPEEPGWKSISMIFIFKDRNENLDIIHTFRKNFKHVDSLWEFVTPFDILVHDPEDDNPKDDPHNRKFSELTARIVGISLSGPNLESWSITIPVEVSKCRVDEMLLEFQAKVCLKHFNWGLIRAPVCVEESFWYSDAYNLADIVQEVFPKITFFQTFCDNDEPCFFGDRFDDDVHGHQIFILVFTYE